MADKKDYLENLETFEDFFDFSVDVSDSTGRIHVPTHLVRANQLFTRLTVTSMSIIHLCPDNRIWGSSSQFWDFISVATLARNLIENYHAFFYIGVEKVTTDERSFRLDLFNYHLINEKYRLYKEGGSSEEILKDFEEKLPIAKEGLKTHPFFIHLSREKAKKILTGGESMILSQKEISARVPFNTYEFFSLYRLFSDQTHSTSYAFFSKNNERGRGAENDEEVHYLAMTLDFCTKYLSAAILDMTKLFPSCVEKVNKTKLQVIREKFNSYIS
jgi:hypothetical protein